MQCDDESTVDSIYCNNLRGHVRGQFQLASPPESRQHLRLRYIFEFRFAHYNKLPEHAVDLLLLLLICMMQCVIQKGEKGERERGKLN